MSDTWLAYFAKLLFIFGVAFTMEAIWPNSSQCCYWQGVIVGVGGYCAIIRRERALSKLRSEVPDDH